MSYQESCPEVGVAVVARCGEDVGHPAGGRLWQDGGDEGEARSRCVVVPRRRNWASATPNQAVGLAVQKSGSLKNLVGGCAAGGLLARSAAFSSTLSMSQMRKKIPEEKKCGVTRC